MKDSEFLIQRIREALMHIPDVEEKRMFGGICFMVNGKMCICANKNDMMCRIGPSAAEEALEKNGCRPMVHRGKTMKGYVFIDMEEIKTKADFDYWVKLSLDFNKLAESSKKKLKKLAN